MFRLKNIDIANFQSAVPVAAPRRLRNGIKSGGRPENNRKINIDSRLDQLRADHAAGKSCCHPFPNRFQNFGTVNRTHHRAQMIIPFPALQSEKQL